MEKRIIECVPNFSEGRNKEVIRQIAEVIEKSEGVKLLDVDPGEATNRTVVTFVGTRGRRGDGAGRRTPRIGAYRHAPAQGSASAHGRLRRAASDPRLGRHA